MKWAQSLHLTKGSCEWCVGHANGSFAPVRNAFSASNGRGGSSSESSSDSGEATAATGNSKEYIDEKREEDHVETVTAPTPKHHIVSAALPCVDGEAYYPTLYECMLHAKHEIFITDWWLHPYTFLKRPAKDYPDSRLDRILELKAKQGIKINILLWKEIELAVPHASYWSSRYLASLHRNITCMRHPNHFGSRGVRYWSHHEKIVVIDQHIAFIGGLDLTLGRYDTHDHNLFDYEHDESLLNKNKVHQKGKGSGMEEMNSIQVKHHKKNKKNKKSQRNEVEKENSVSLCHDDTGCHGGGLYPGRDYNNARVENFDDVSRWDDQIDRQIVPRMPWHDVHVMLIGEPARGK